MQYSGYNQQFRYEVLMSALNAFEEMKKKDENGEQPLYRPKEWKKVERRKEKERKKKDWYKRGGYETVIFVPCTHESMLLKKLQRDIDKSQLKVKLNEKAGTTLGNLLRTSDPRKDKKCDRTDCPVCTTGGKGNCKTLDVNYFMTCENCEHDGIYKGTTTRGGYIRGKEHIADIIKERKIRHVETLCRETQRGNQRFPNGHSRHLQKRSHATPSYRISKDQSDEEGTTHQQEGRIQIDPAEMTSNTR